MNKCSITLAHHFTHQHKACDSKKIIVIVLWQIKICNRGSTVPICNVNFEHFLHSGHTSEGQIWIQHILFHAKET